MAANIVDELIVVLRMDAEAYKKADAEVDRLVTKTERKAKKTDAEAARREKDRAKRLRDSTAAARAFSGAMGTLASILGAVVTAGVGGVLALTAMETNLRRTAVATGMSNRELDAWSATARRLGADAEAGKQAIADLARESKQFNITGSAPTLQAFARMGVRVGPDMAPVDVLANAQKVYRQSAPAQQQQIEAGLSAQGVSNDIIVMLKSEKDVREEYTRSLSAAASENKSAMAAVSDAMASVRSAVTNVANTLATVVEPYVKSFGEWTNKASSSLSAFNDRVIAAGGGIDGFMRVLDQESPELSTVLRALGDGLRVLGEAVDLAAYGVQLMAKGFDFLVGWIYSKLPAGLQAGLKEAGGAIGQAVGVVGDAVQWAWKEAVPEARRQGANPVGGMLGDHGGAARLTPSAAARIAAGELGGGGARAAGGLTNMQDVMGYLVTRHGFNVAQAAAIASNIQGESGFNPAASGKVETRYGRAKGLVQLLHPDRMAPFVAAHGVTPDKTSWQTQLDWIAQNPAERALLNKALSGANGAADLGGRVSRIYEAHGNKAEDARRATQAQQYANSYNGNAGASGGPSININGDVTVQANNPQELAGSLARVSNIQNYTSAVR
ncbi:phage tail tip lysozyme [Cupriavidus sp. 2TAF22]|uniref:phage tail tip lysozyme n=1 Tax=unclassified Cupriavidus TaxID=2640874 RepID=UPI003F8E0688